VRLSASHLAIRQCVISLTDPDMRVASAHVLLPLRQ
jgi:hypothetical protein